jgi:hypothetical protein
MTSNAVRRSCYHDHVRLLGVGVALALALFAASAMAAPQVEIKAQTQLVLGRVRMLPDGNATVDGQLLDKLTGDGIPNQRVEVALSGNVVIAVTSTDGKFTVGLPAEPGTQEVALSFRGGGALDPAQLTITTDPTRDPVTLALSADEAPEGVHIIVLASADDHPVQVTAHLSVGLPTAPALKTLAVVQSGAPYLLTRHAAGGTGLRHVHAAFDGDATHQAAGADLTVELTSATVTTAEVNSKSLAYEDDLTFTGSVRDQDGHPVARAAVTLTSGDRRLAQGATTEDGSYKLVVEGEIVGTGDIGLQVQADPGGQSLRASRSPPIIVHIASPEPVPVSYTLAAFVATALAAGGFFIARTKPWRRFAKRATPAAAPAATIEAEQVEGGVVMAKPGLISTLRRPSDDGIGGIVCDMVRGRPLGDAIVRVLLADGTTREATTDVDGTFAIETLPGGEHRCEVYADGHVAEKFACAIPHRGEFRGVRVQLVPVRERVFQLYRRAAEPVLPEARLWGIWTPRQIVDHVRARRPSPALAELTDFVEEIYFSGRVASENVIPVASERVDHAIRERIRVPL